MYKVEDGFLGDLHKRYLTFDNQLEVNPTTTKDLKAGQIYRAPVVPDDQPSMVDAVGYVDPNKRIKQMVEAGMRIDAWNHALYDFENGESDDDHETYARERDDWDDLEMLTEAGRAKELYRREMYAQYMNALKSEAASKDPSGERTEPPGATQKDSEGKETTKA